MNDLPVVWLVRHGETEWSREGRHTGHTDIPLTPRGEAQARGLRARLPSRPDLLSLTSPWVRARRTAELSGHGAAAVDRSLVEWDYGEYEGRRSAEILAERPDWDLFRDGCPGGESPAAIGARADHVIERLRGTPGQALLFSSGHFLRVLAARWLRLPPTAARGLFLDPASVSRLGYEHDRSRPVIRLWNETVAARR